MKRKILLASVVATAVCASLDLASAQSRRGDNGLPKVTYDPASQIPKERIPASVKEGFTFIGVGDLLMGNAVLAQAGPEVEKVLKIVRAGDAAIANQEAPLFDNKKLRMPMKEGGGVLIGTPGVATDAKAMGIDVVGIANNHAVDWGANTVVETIKTLDDAGMLHAGGGRNRTEARAPVYFDTPKGRVGVVAAASTVNGPSAAADEVGDGPARPGISVLHTTRIANVSAEEMATLKNVATRYGRRASTDGDTVTLLGQTYRVSNQKGFTYTMNALDHFEILRSIRGAKQVSDMVAFTIHAHESDIGSDESPIPGDFQQKLFHDVIDAGGDVVVGTGSHALRGIEIYKGKPIFYNVGIFVFQGNTPAGQESMESMGIDMTRVTPADVKNATFNNPAEWYDSVITATEFGAGGNVKEIRIYPLDTNAVPPNKLKGVPHLASPEVGKRILETMKGYSAVYGTEIKIENGVGIIRPKV